MGLECIVYTSWMHCAYLDKSSTFGVEQGKHIDLKQRKKLRFYCNLPTAKKFDKSLEILRYGADVQGVVINIRYYSI